MAPEDNPADDIEAVRCPVSLGWAQCELPEGHEGPHDAEDHSYQSPGPPPVPNHARCQHQDLDCNLDCDSEAVLCIHHGGHDACAVELMETQRRLGDLETYEVVKRLAPGQRVTVGGGAAPMFTLTRIR